MKAKIKRFLDATLSWFPLYKCLIGGHRYFQQCQDQSYDPEEFMHFGKGAKIGRNVYIQAPERCSIGEAAAISSGCSINAIGGFRLGRFSGIASGCVIFTTEHRFMGATTLPFDLVRQVKPVIIEDFVWIGARVLIHSGVRIGEGAIVGMGSVVNADVAPLTIVSGNPAKVIGKRSAVQFERLREASAGRDPHAQCSLLWVPKFTQRKFENELREFGFDVAQGEEYFLYRKRERSLERIKNTEADQSAKGGDRQRC